VFLGGLRSNSSLETKAVKVAPTATAMAMSATTWMRTLIAYPRAAPAAVPPKVKKTAPNLEVDMVPLAELDWRIA
jgi:hypothetical protein